MKIEFDTQNTHEIKIVAEILSRFGGQPVNDNLLHAQPEVARNAGTTALVSSPMISKTGGSSVSGGEAAVAASAPAVEKRRGRPAKVKEEVAEPAAPQEIKIVRPEPAPAPEPEPAPEPVAVAEPEPEFDFDQVDEQPELTLDDVRVALQKFAEKHGLPDGKALLHSFKASRISELAATDYAAFIKACQA